MKTFALAVVLGLGSVISAPAHGALIITVDEIGPNVVVAGSGSLNLTALTQGTQVLSATNNAIGPASSLLTVGQIGSYRNYTSITGPSNFGSGGTTPSSFLTGGTGTLVGVNGSTLLVADPYTSETAITNSFTWNNKSFSSLGITEGTYVWNWGAGPTADSLTIKATGAPEPAAMSLMMIGGTMALLKRRRNVGRA